MSFPNIIFGTPGMQFRVNTVAQGQGVNSMGTRMTFADGRQFRWGKNGAVTGVIGDIQQAGIPITNHVLQTLTTAAAVGDGSVTLTIGNTAVAADFYKDGYFTVELGTGFGQLFTVRSHLAAAGNASTFVVPFVETVQVAIPTTANTVSLTQNLYQNFIQAVVTTPTAQLVGVELSNMVAATFGFLATKGPAMVSTAGTFIIGETIIGASGTAGAGAPGSAATLFLLVGTVIRVATTTNKSVINLMID